MQVVDMLKGKKPVQGRVDRLRSGRQVENAVIELLYHLVFMFDAAVHVF